jgi:hypothetical protein
MESENLLVFIDSVTVICITLKVKEPSNRRVRKKILVLRSTGIEREVRSLNFELTPPVEVFLMSK